MAAGAPGHGSLTVDVDIPASTAADLPDLASGLRASDLLATGWQVSRPRAAPGGGVLLRATHTFSSFSQVPYLAAEIAGSGPLRTRPFRVTLTRSSSALRAQYSVRALVDLRCAMACFADPALEHSLGYGLGLPPGALRQALGPHPDRDLAFSVVLSLPGKALGRPQGAPRRSLRPGEVTRSFPVALGAQISAGFRTEVVDTARLQQLLAWVCAGALVVLLTAASLVLRHRRRARRARRRRRGWV